MLFLRTNAGPRERRPCVVVVGSGYGVTNPMSTLFLSRTVCLGESCNRSERSMIRERSIAGQLAARERGRVPGRVRALSAEVEAELVADYLSGLHTYKGLSLKYDVSLSVAKRAVYRVTKTKDARIKGKV